jgi:hypothetical protein
MAALSLDGDFQTPSGPPKLRDLQRKLQVIGNH